MALQVSDADETTPTYDRRSTDRYLRVIERQLDDLREAVKILDRDGSRGHGVLVQRVADAEQRRADLVEANRREHDSICADVHHLAGEVDTLREIVAKTNVDQLPARVDKLEQEQAGRLGLQKGVLRIVGPYAGFIISVITVVYALSQSR